MNEALNVNIVNFDKSVVSNFSVPAGFLDVDFDPVFFNQAFARMKKAAYKYSNKSIVKSESQVSGGGKKPFKQKGTGNARMGSIRSLNCVGGGTFGRNLFERRFVKIPKQETSFFKSMILSYKFKQNLVTFIDNPSFDFHSTKEALKKFSNFTDKSILVVHEDSISFNSLLAVRNVKKIKYVNYSMLTCFDLINYDFILISQNALKRFSE